MLEPASLVVAGPLRIAVLIGSGLVFAPPSTEGAIPTEECATYPDAILAFTTDGASPPAPLNRASGPVGISAADTTTNSVLFSDHHVTAVWTREGRDVAAVMRPGHYSYATFRRTLSIFMASLLARRDAALLHGGSFVLDGLAGVILGPSGAGKSTSRRLLCPPAEALADDDVVVSLTQHGATVHTTSLDRIFQGSESRPLAALFLPTKAATFSLRRLTSPEALVRFLSDNRRDLARWPHEVRRELLTFLRRLFEIVPAFDLQFSRDLIDVEAVQRALRQPSTA